MLLSPLSLSFLSSVSPIYCFYLRSRADGLFAFIVKYCFHYCYPSLVLWNKGTMQTENKPCPITKHLRVFCVLSWIVFYHPILLTNCETLYSLPSTGFGRLALFFQITLRAFPTKNLNPLGMFMPRSKVWWPDINIPAARQEEGHQFWSKYSWLLMLFGKIVWL